MKSFKSSSAKNVIKKEKVKKPSVPAEWLYMSEQEITVSQIREALDPAVYPDVEVWAEAGVLEIPMGEKSSMDIEAVEAQMDDDYSNAFLQEHAVKSLFMVTVKPEDYEKVEAAMKQITASCGGFFCGDTEDFTPVVKPM